MQMRRTRKNKTIVKMGFIFIVLLLSLATMGASYSSWFDNLYISGTVTTGEWSQPCLCIRKTLDGSYTDPYTGDDLSVPNYALNLIFKSDNNHPGFPTKFKMTIEITNNCEDTYTNLVVTDKIGPVVAPRTWTPSQGTVTWVSYAPGHKPWDGIHYGFNELTWNVGDLGPEQTATLVIWIETLQNPKDKYEPTSEDQDLVFNQGATLNALDPEEEPITLTTEDITINIDPYGTPNDNLAIIATPMPYSTPYACVESGSDLPCDC